MQNAILTDAYFIDTRVAEMITDIAQSSIDQAESIGQITDVVQSNSAASEKTASMAQELASQPLDLRP